MRTASSLTRLVVNGLGFIGQSVGTDVLAIQADQAGSDQHRHNQHQRFSDIPCEKHHVGLDGRPCERNIDESGVDHGPYLPKICLTFMLIHEGAVIRPEQTTIKMSIKIIFKTKYLNKFFAGRRPIGMHHPGSRTSLARMLRTSRRADARRR